MADTVHRAPDKSMALDEATLRLGIPSPPAVSGRPKRPQWPTLAGDLAGALEDRRIFVLFPFAVLLGLIGYRILPAEPESWALAASGAALFALLLLCRSELRLLRLLALAGGLWFGAVLLPLHAHFFATPLLTSPIYGAFEAVVDEVLSEDESARRIIVSSLVADLPRNTVDIRRARLFTPPNPPLQPGDRIRAMLRLAPVPGPVVPGGFDGQFGAYYAGIGAYGNVTSGLERVAAAEGWHFRRMVDGLRSDIAARIAAILGQQPAAIATAMTVGDQSSITDETREIMAGSGLAHVYSISGLHLSIIAGGTFFVIRAGLAALPGLSQRLPVKKLAAVVGILTACGYLMIAGGFSNTPAFRSTLMLGLVFGAILAGRRALTMRNVAIAALVIIVFDPASIFRPSFQLSFAAVVALIGAYETLRRTPDGDWSAGRRMIRAVGGTALTSLIAGLATLLFSAYHFQQTAPLGVLGNVLAMPIVGFVIMPFALVSVLLMPLGLEHLPVLVMGWGIEVMLLIAQWVTGMSEGMESHPLLTPAALVIGLLGLAWFAFFTTAWRVVGPLAIIPGVLLFGFDRAPDVLIADTTQAVALRGENGFGLVTGRAGTFAVNVWSEQYGEPIEGRPADLRCDSHACLASGIGGLRVSVVTDRNAFAEDCARADLVIARLPAPLSCRSTAQVIDAEDLRRGGVHHLIWDEAERRFEIRPAMVDLERPWRIRER